MEEVVDNARSHRFELIEGGHLAYADYRVDGDRLVVAYVYAAPQLRGSGAAGRLMEGVLSAARDKGRRVVPLCGYAAAYIRRHPQHHDLLG